MVWWRTKRKPEQSKRFVKSVLGKPTTETGLTAPKNRLDSNATRPPGDSEAAGPNFYRTNSPLCDLRRDYHFEISLSLNCSPILSCLNLCVTNSRRTIKPKSDPINFTGRHKIKIDRALKSGSDRAVKRIGQEQRTQPSASANHFFTVLPFT